MSYENVPKTKISIVFQIITNNEYIYSKTNILTCKASKVGLEYSVT